MLIKTNLKDVEAVIINSKIYKVVKGIAEVPEEAGKMLISFEHWEEHLEPLEKEILDELRNVEKTTKKEK
jgi:hypothetical protein